MKISHEARGRILLSALALASALLLLPVASWAAPYARDAWDASLAGASAANLSPWRAGGAAQAPETEAATEASQGSGPRLVHRVQPRFPPIAELNFASCQLKAMVKVDDKGEVERVTIVKPCSSFNWYFEHEARQAISRWKFDPARTADGYRVASVYPCVINFRW